MKDMPKPDWSVLPLRSACEVVSTGPFGSLLGKKDYVEEGVPVVNPIDIVDSCIQSVSVKRVSLDTSKRLASYRMRSGDIVVARRGELGRCARITVESDGWLCGTGSFFVRPKGLLSPEFLARYFGSPAATEFFRVASTGATMPNISNKTLSSLPIPIPPLEEQHRIVSVLDEAFEGLARARAHAEANLQNTRELFDSALRSVFTVEGAVWDQEHLPDVCIDFGRGKSRHRPRNDPTLYGGDFPFVQTGDIAQANHFITDFKQTYSDAGLAQSKLWPRDTVCVAIVGATIGESGILTFDACFPDSVIGMAADPDKADPEYIEFLLQFVKAELKEAGKGSARDNINLGTFSDRRFPVPSLAQQAKVVDRLNHLYQNSHDLVEEYTGKLASLDNLRQSLLQKAFAGELT